MVKRKTRIIYISGSVMIAMLLVGCMTTDPVRVEEDFGTSKAQMIQEQTYNQSAAARRESLPVREMDGTMAVRSLGELRNDVKRDKEEINNVFNIELGNDD